MAVLYASICSFLIVLGQVLWKIAIEKNGGVFRNDVPMLQNLLNLIFSPWMLGGLAVYFFATAYWVFLLGKYEYSYIYPMTSIVYLISFLFAIFLFKENVNIYRWIGVLLIIAGVISINHGR
jgi:uncharacterized membrane protein